MLENLYAQASAGGIPEVSDQFSGYGMFSPAEISSASVLQAGNA
jgi:hypothetical protein